jgi:hypothetical protein
MFFITSTKATNTIANEIKYVVSIVIKHTHPLSKRVLKQPPPFPYKSYYITLFYIIKDIS